MAIHQGSAGDQLSPLTPPALAQWIWDRLGTPWRLGRNDCVLFGLRAADYQTGSHLAQRAEGTYMTWHQAAKAATAVNVEQALRQEGWRDAEPPHEIGDLWVLGGRHPSLVVYVGHNFVSTVTQAEGVVLAPVAAIHQPIRARLRKV